MLRSFRKSKVIWFNVWGCSECKFGIEELLWRKDSWREEELETREGWEWEDFKESKKVVSEESLGGDVEKIGRGNSLGAGESENFAPA